ncbi:MAG: glucose 1-dehydrogenase [Eggerthellaceae bacterium]|nr:glucose 1-dehydrogenase [Eggerthellaceae bacterium]
MLTGKSVVVTGASSGMGKAITELFVQNGASVVAVARRKDRLDELVTSLEGAAGKVLAFEGDVSNIEDVEGMIDFAVSEFGKLDVLVNNAGVMDDMAAIGDATDEKYEKVFAVNVYGPFAAMRKAVQVFLSQGTGGNIINVSSIGAQHQAAGVVYGASKAAVNAMTRSTAYMYLKDGIRVNAIAPGSIATEIATSMGQPNVEGYTKVSPVIALSPDPGPATAIADAALYLASDQSSFVSGVILPVDGGWTSF